MTDRDRLTDEDFDVELEEADLEVEEEPLPTRIGLVGVAQVLAIGGAILVLVSYFLPWYELGGGTYAQKIWPSSQGTWGEVFVFGSLALVCVTAVVMVTAPGRSMEIFAVALAGATLVAVVAGFANLVTEVHSRIGPGVSVDLRGGFAIGLAGAGLIALALIFEIFLYPVLSRGELPAVENGD